MSESFPAAAGSGRRPGARFLSRTARQTLAESLYLLTGPAIAPAGLRGLGGRLHAAGGRLRVTSPPGGPATIDAELPCC